ncbi:MAG: DUF5666 domain-containing protein [Ardenticatenia bacterium]|nr:DUF5666 domain-containing protein [Ardenticatenia bacterium]
MRRGTYMTVVGLMLFLLLPLVALAGVADGGELEHKGIIESMPAGGRVGEWRIGGQVFQVTSSTRFEVEHGLPAVGTCAEVKYYVDNGTNVAVKVETKGADECGDVDGFDFKGIVEDMPAASGAGTWTISGVAFQVTAMTRFETEHGPLTVGACVEVEYVVQGNDNVAIEINTQEPYECQGTGIGTQEARGIVEAMPADGLVGPWTISGQSYQATNTTVFEQREGPFTLGACVEVEYVVQNGVRVALKIKTDDTCDGNRTKARGLIEAFPATLVGTWTIGGVQYEATATTEFDTRYGDFAVGVCAEVEYVMSGTTRQALAIKTESADECGLPVQGGELETKGLIDAMPADGLVGEWVIDGESYTATAQTRFEQDHGVFKVGQCVEVKYRLDGTGRVATKIETQRRQACSSSDQVHEAYGVIEALPATGLIGTWTVGGVDYEITTTTTLENGPFTVGLLVEIKFVVNPDGTLIALQVEGKHAVDDDDQALAQAYGRIEAFPATLVGTWTIGGVQYEANAFTAFEQDDGPFAVGACAKVRYFDRNGARVAAKIETQSDDDCQADNGATVSRLYGFVEDMPPQGFVGTWTIGGTLFEVTAATQLEEEHGLLVVGAFVEVKYIQRNGVNMALSIETHVPPEAGEHTRIGYLRQNGTTWTVNDTTFVITDATILDDSMAPLRDGQAVVINGYQPAGGGGFRTAAAHATTLVATRVTAIHTIYTTYLPVTTASPR